MTTTLREAAQQALEALEWSWGGEPMGTLERDAITALRTALAQQAEPVAWSGYDLDGMVEAFSRVIESHYQRANPFQNPVDMDAQMALRILRGFIPAMKAYAAPPQQAERVEPVAHRVVAGALFDFMGWLTSRRERLVLSSTDDAAPAADAIKDFAEMRGLSLDDAKVQDWNAALAQQAEPAQEPVAGRAFLERILAAMEGVIDVADRKTDEFDALRSCVIDLTLMLHTAPPQRKPLTEEEIERAAHKSYLMGERIWTDDTRKDLIDFARAVERAVERAHGIGRQTDPQIEDRLARHGIPKP